ncbi:MAG TPA: tetratricopeptide repeat protein [Steroidobacteraceae bacterium]|nr:tetratricopeptide repeat protein [Steroidobacteraceae bacterium]
MKPNPQSGKVASQAMLRAALAYSRGAWAEAEQWCRQILAAQKDDFDALNLLGIIAVQTQRLDEAARLLRRAVAVHPRQATAHNNYGNVLRELKRYDDAVHSYGRALKIKPDYAEALNNRGTALQQLQRLEEALASYDQALKIKPDYAEALSNRGTVLKELRRLEEAVASFDKALALRPDYAEAFHNRGNALRELKRLEEALASYEKALALNPRYFKYYQSLGSLLYQLGRDDLAAGVYRRWLELEPANPIAQHLYAATSGEGVPQRASAQYVRKLFDEFADSFDSNLQGLDYAAPQLLRDALVERTDCGRGGLFVLDAGCGTGLCGVLLRSAAEFLAGVDLSPRMLAKARARNLYDELFEGELCAYMASRAQAFDVVVCADTLIYFGALDEAVTAARLCLRPKGVFAFTVEALPEETSTPFRLCAHGRYAHAAGYLRATMESSGFSDVDCRSIVVRKEATNDVRGYLVIGSVRGATPSPASS